MSIKSIISTEKIPIKMWIDENNVEESAIQQAKNLANLPFVFKHIAIMPDVHTGYGATIGSVFAAKNTILPSAVGFDIGCGVAAVQTSLTNIDTETLKVIMGDVRKEIPIGVGSNNSEFNEDGMHALEDILMSSKFLSEGNSIVMREWKKAGHALGSLGSNNHFIEIQKSDDGHIGIMLHSGSRNLGHQIATHYNKLAVELNEKYYSVVPKKWELAFLPLDSEEGSNYRDEMEFCLAFAQANRDIMMQVIKNIFTRHFKSISFLDQINIHHNYAALENHFGKNVMVHRKGATSAREGQMGLIPGDQGTASYVVCGLGNPKSFHSCSHGAGRILGRKQAIRELDMKEEVRKMEEKGILHSIRSQDDLDEAPGAYKNIEEVMKNQDDLVEIVVELKPLAVVKG